MYSNHTASSSNASPHIGRPPLHGGNVNNVPVFNNSISSYLMDTSKSNNNENNNNGYNNNTNPNFKVVVRIRPPLPREIEGNRFISTVQLQGGENKAMSLIEYYNHEMVDPHNIKDYLENTKMYTMHHFNFDHVYNQDSTQLEVYEDTAKPAVMSALKGYNATILAYGQTGTGKTHTMEGFKYNPQDPQRGIIPRCMEEIFRYIENISNARTTFMVRASYLQIYNENISDLLRTDRTNLLIREDKKKGVYVEGLSEWAVRTPGEIYSLLQKGAMSRATASTKMNDVSSRSHAVFIIIVEQMVSGENDDLDAPKQIRVGKLNLVDLAGSENAKVTGATGKRFEECKKINQSLSFLGNVIAALTDAKQPKSHIPYRDSKITRLLEDSLGGNCITTMMAMVSPALEAFGETLSSLKFASRAKNIKNAPIINEDLDQKALLRKYETELKRLRGELEDRNKTLIDKKKVFELEEERKRAELDKVAAVAALEARSREFMMEREEKKKLEEKIRSMNSQLLVGGRKIEDTPQFRSALEEQQKLIRQQYEKRLQELEKERNMIEEDKAQVDRYKQLLLKQRDIMIALTTRLNERDETIIQLQEELDAYDRIHRESEETLEGKVSRINQLEALLRENDIQVPVSQESNANPTKKRMPERAYSHYTPDTVNYDGQETYNITKGNLLTAEEKIVELTNVADTQKVEILRLKSQLENFQNNNETNELIKTEMSIMADQVKKAQDNQSSLMEVIRRKEEELKGYQNNQPIGEVGISPAQLEIKDYIDQIIESLSSQSEPNKLQDVAKKLLILQKLINSTTSNITSTTPPVANRLSEKSSFKNISNIVNNISTTPTMESLENRTSYVGYSPNGRPSSAQPQRNEEKGVVYNNGANNYQNSYRNTTTSTVSGSPFRRPTPKSSGDFSAEGFLNNSNKLSMGNMSSSINTASPIISVMNGVLQGGTQNGYSNTRKETPNTRDMIENMYMGGYERPQMGSDQLSKKRPQSGGVFGSGQFDNLLRIDTKRSAMTVEEMLKMKRSDSGKRKI